MSRLPHRQFFFPTETILVNYSDTYQLFRTDTIVNKQVIRRVPNIVMKTRIE